MQQSKCCALPLGYGPNLFLPSAPQTISADGRVTIQHPAKPIRNSVTSFPTCSCLVVCSSDTGLHSITAQHGKAHSQSVRLWLSSCSCFCRLLLSPILAPNRKKMQAFFLFVPSLVLSSYAESKNAASYAANLQGG